MPYILEALLGANSDVAFDGPTPDLFEDRPQEQILPRPAAYYFPRQTVYVCIRRGGSSSRESASSSLHRRSGRAVSFQSDLSPDRPAALNETVSEVLAQGLAEQPSALMGTILKSLGSIRSIRSTKEGAPVDQARPVFAALDTGCLLFSRCSLRSFCLLPVSPTRRCRRPRIA